MTWGERLILIQTLLTFPLIALDLKLTGLQVTQSHLIKLSPNAKSEISPKQLERARRAAYIVNRTAYYLCPVGNCLKRSLTLWFLLRRRSIVSLLRIGVRREHNEFQAHAWIECEGQVLNDWATVHDHYSVFDNLREEASTFDWF